MQKPLNPSTKSSLPSRRPERSLTPLALGVRGAAPLRAFLSPCWTGTDDPGAIRLPRGAGRPESCKLAAKPGRFPFFPAFSFKSEREKQLVKSEKREEPFTPHLHGVVHPPLHQDSATFYSENQRRPVHGSNPGEAGATPPVAARCVTASVGSLPPHQFPETRSPKVPLNSANSAFNTRLKADVVNGERDIWFTFWFTDAFTLKASETTRVTEVRNSIWT
jgi:hypothetical protein